MALVNNGRESINTKFIKSRVLSTTTLGIVFLIIPIVLIFVDPIFLLMDYRLRLDNGTLLHELLLTEIEGPKMYLYLFNITNAEEFRSGVDQKLTLKEIGPFVYQEYRSNKDVVINREPGIMRYTPKVRTEYILEESYGRLEDIYLTLPNIPLLSLAAMFSKYPYFMQQLFNMVITGAQSKAFMNINAHDFVWGYTDPLIDLANKMFPGLIYFKSFGLLERFYDVDVDYHMVLGTTSLDKFSVKSVKRKKIKEGGSIDVSEKTLFYNNSYEGALFPLSSIPDTNMDIFRHNLCKSLRIQHVGHRRMYYGGQAFVYNFHNTTFNDRQLCDSTGWCPDGLMTLAPCYYDMPIALSKGHFLDADPLLLDGVDGLTPDRKLHDSEIAVDSKIGVTVTGSVSLQVNLFVADVGYNPETKLFKKTTVVPVSLSKLKQPRMLKEVQSALQLVYSQGPAVTLAFQMLCTASGLGLLLYSLWSLHQHRLADRGTVTDTRVEVDTTQACQSLLSTDVC